MKYRTNCPHNDTGFCANCRDEGFLMLGLSKAQGDLDTQIDSLLNTVSLETLREVKRSALAILSYTERIMFLEERKRR